jgi:16S rRNA (guanine527-N7)-methyltransferase
MDRAAFSEAATNLGLPLTEGQLDAFAAFQDALYKTNEVMNLTRVPREEAWIRHFLDSLLFQSLIPVGASVLDIGTGPGFPAWPLACARPDLKVTALDSNGKMLGFLQQHLLPNLQVVNARAEEWGVREKFDVVTGRALAPLAIQLELSAQPCKVHGLVIPMRTPADEQAMISVDEELLSLQERERLRVDLPGTDTVRLFPVYEKLARTPRNYPRRWPEIKAKPLNH